MEVQFKTALESATVRTCIVGIIALLSVLGIHLAVDDQKITQIADMIALIAGPILFALAAKYRGGNSIIVSGEEKAQIVSTTKTDKAKVQPIVAPPNQLIGRAATPPKDRWKDVPCFFLVLTGTLCLMGTGCGNRAELIAYREGMNKAIEPILKEHDQWSKELVKPKAEQKLPNLNDGETDADRANWLSARTKWHEEYERQLTESRANDSK